jgi:hypothetical protein
MGSRPPTDPPPRGRDKSFAASRNSHQVMVAGMRLDAGRPEWGEIGFNSLVIDHWSSVC